MNDPASTADEAMLVHTSGKGKRNTARNCQEILANDYVATTMAKVKCRICDVFLMGLITPKEESVTFRDDGTDMELPAGVCDELPAGVCELQQMNYRQVNAWR